jgi:hypothetical protein
MRYVARCSLLRVFVVEVKVSTFASEVTNATAYLPLILLCLIRLNSSFVLKVKLNQQTVRSETYILIILSPADQGSLDGTLVSESYHIMDRILRKRVVAKTIETAFV